MCAPLKIHWTQVKRILKYLKGTINYGIIYSKSNNKFNNNNIFGYSDASFAPNFTDRKSISGYVFMFNGAAISWRSKKQKRTALSSCEAEYVALNETAQESQWLCNLHKEINNKHDPIIVYEDNQAAIKIAENNMFSDNIKHLEVKHHYIRDLIKDKQFKIIYCPTNFMIADA